MHKLHELIEQGQPIYVRNLSGDHPDEITKLIMLEIKPIHGPSRSIKIPPIDKPINLSSLVSPPYILGESQDLLDLLNRDILELIDPQEAIEEMKDEKTQRIVQKAMRDIHNRSAFDPRRKVTKSKDGRRKVPRHVINEENDLSGAQNPLKKIVQAAADDLDYEYEEIKLSPSDQEVSPNILEMCATLVADPSMADSILEDLEVIPEGDMTDANLGHLIKHVGVKKVMNWAQQMLAERGVVEVDEEDGEKEEVPIPRSKRNKQRGRKKARR